MRDAGPPSYESDATSFARISSRVVRGTIEHRVDGLDHRRSERIGLTVVEPDDGNVVEAVGSPTGLAQADLDLSHGPSSASVKVGL